MFLGTFFGVRNVPREKLLLKWYIKIKLICYSKGNLFYNYIKWFLKVYIEKNGKNDYPQSPWCSLGYIPLLFCKIKTVVTKLPQCSHVYILKTSSSSNNVNI